jgi:hypothetical protein
MSRNAFEGRSIWWLPRKRRKLTMEPIVERLKMSADPGDAIQTRLQSIRLATRTRLRILELKTGRGRYEFDPIASLEQSSHVRVFLHIQPQSGFYKHKLSGFLDLTV